jgi:hypothetical protein
VAEFRSIHWSYQLQTLWERLSYSMLQRCINPGRQIATATKFHALVPNICGSSVWNLLLGFPSSAWNFEMAPIVNENCVHVPLPAVVFERLEIKLGIVKIGHTCMKSGRNGNCVQKAHRHPSRN